MHLGFVWLNIPSQFQESVFPQTLQQCPHILTHVVCNTVLVLDDLVQFRRNFLFGIGGSDLSSLDRLKGRFAYLRFHPKQLAHNSLRILSHGRDGIGYRKELPVPCPFAWRALHTQESHVALLLWIMVFQVLQSSRNIGTRYHCAFQDSLIH